MILKKPSSFEIIRPSFSDEGTFSVRARGKPWKQLIDVHENSGLNRQKKTLQRRVLVVTAVKLFLFFKAISFSLFFFKVRFFFFLERSYPEARANAGSYFKKELSFKKP